MVDVNRWLIAFGLFLWVVPGMASTSCVAKSAIDYVNPLIGTASRRADMGNSAGMMPYVCPPFAAVEWVPMTRLSEVGILSFSAADGDFLGFIAPRQPAIWMGEWGQFSLAPQASQQPVCDYRARGLRLDKAKCVYTPCYAKIVTTEGIVAELAGSSHAAIMRFTYPEGAPRRLVFDASRVFLGCISSTNAFPGSIRFEGKNRICAWNRDFVDFDRSDPKAAPHVKYVIECSEPYAATGVYEGGVYTGFRQKFPWSKIPSESYPAIFQRPGETVAEGDCVGGWADFPGEGRTLLVKIGSSMIDEETAWKNLDREIGEGFDFDKVVSATKAAWEKQLSKISIDAPERVKTIFYTAMYHASLYPRDITEEGRYVSPYDGKMHMGDMYTNYSMWDTYRAEHALLTFIAPERVDGMMNALLNAYREGGWLPKWPNPGYTGAMIGGCAEMLLAEAYSKGFRGFDLETAYAAVKKNATVPQANDDDTRWVDGQYWTGHCETRGGLGNYMRLGYVAADVTAESVSRTQDFGLNDTAAAILADATGHTEDARMFRERMCNYTNLWNVSRQQFWPRNKDGTWVEKIHRGWNREIGNDYTEQSPETAVWGIPYDVPGLVSLCGGLAAFERKLDDYFERSFWNGRKDGLSCHENETTHHISYLYAAAGIPEKTAKNVRRILTETYSDQEWGMEGNEDCGQMSAWYMLSSLGFYPLNPATDEYVMGSPLVDKAVIRIGHPFKQAEFTIVAKNQGRANYVVKSVKLNGVELKDGIIRQKDIVAGGILEFEMAAGEKSVTGNQTKQETKQQGNRL